VLKKLRFRICRISENDLKPSFSCDAGTAQAIFQHSLLLHFEICERVKELRKVNNMSVKAVAEETGEGTFHWRMVELGVRSVTAYNCLRLHEIFNVSLQYIVTGKEFEKKPGVCGNGNTP